MAAKNKQRFERIYREGSWQLMEIWLDRQTGVNYLASSNGGLTPLLGRDGRPVISSVDDEDGAY